tara:strand:+ start:49 stop:459 length:411 start_codon:yes stop_codon:yes gene_type:complete
MSNSIQIKKTFTDLDAALEAAKTAGNWIFEGYENNIASHKLSDKRCGVTEYYLTEKNDILYIAEFEGRRCLNKVKLGCSLNNAAIAVAHQLDEGFSVIPNFLISKSDRQTIKEACEAKLLLVDQSLAAELTSELAA